MIPAEGGSVRAVDPGSTAERAGLKAGDEIKQWNGENVPRRAEFWLRNKKPGDDIEFAYPARRATNPNFRLLWAEVPLRSLF